MEIATEEQEFDFNKWLESIEFVNSKSELLPAELKEDNSEDPEGDRT